MGQVGLEVLWQGWDFLGMGGVEVLSGVVLVFCKA